MKGRRRNKPSKESAAGAVASSHDPQSPFQQPEKKIRKKSQQRRWNRSRQNQRITHQRDTAKNKRPQSSRANLRRNRRHANRDNRRRPNPRKDDRERQRKTHAKQDLCPRHAHGFRRFEHCGIDPAQSHISVPQNRQKRVQHQRDNRSAPANPPEKRNRNQQSKKRKARNRLKN